jgi:uncharacterized protein (DUF1015 family)
MKFSPKNLFIFITEVLMNTTAFSSADILIPCNSVNMEKWSVIACDQYTSEPQYWSETEKITKDSPSALNLILPEVYLEEDDVEKRIEKIHSEMKKVLDSDILKEYKDSMIYVERVQSNNIVREGIIGKIDLEEYDYSKGSTSMVRATESTVIERIPPRVKIRNKAPLELPHIMILIDDPDNTVIEPLKNSINDYKKLYDFTLMQGGGSIKGYLIDKNNQNKINDALCKLGDKKVFEEKYNLKDKPVLLFAMGDGNHSLATAKAYYEQLKAENPDKDLSNHPARYALVEIVNLHSKALEFEAIHRLLTGIDKDKLINEMTNQLNLTKKAVSSQYFTLVTNNSSEKFYIQNKSSNLSVGSVQNFLDKYLKENNGKIDYIHGTDTLTSLVDSDDSIGIILPDMDKSELFPTVISDGALPRKTFSMGHAADKRYYIEARKISL